MRQGDPLAPSLFVIAEEVLSRGLIALYAEGKVSRFVTARGCIAPSHLLFADDTVIFTNGRRNSLKNLMEFLGRYEAASGQLINKTKSCFVIHRNAPRCRVDMIGSVVGFPRKELPIMYLGAPLFAGAPKASFFTFLVDKIRKQIASWNGKLLSKGGRLVLLKSVLYSIPHYVLSISAAPASVIHQID